MAPATSPATPATTPRSSTWAVVAALCLVQFVDVMAVTVVVTTLPRMLADVGGTPADSTLVATGYAMVFGGLLMFGARLGDRLGHRRCILGSLAVFAAGSLLAATATSTLMLTAARCVQGAGAAAAVPSALTILVTVTGAGRARARAVAAWSAAGAAAGASGFLVGGLVSAVGSWRTVFWALLAVSAVLAALVGALVPAGATARAAGGLNLVGSALLTASVMLVVVGATLLTEATHRFAAVLVLCTAALTGVLFALTDRRSAAPLLPPPLLRRPQVRHGTVGAFLNTATTSGVAALITLYLQNTLGYPPIRAAVTFLPLSVLVIAGSAAAARLMTRLPPQRVTAAGLGLIGVGVAAPLLRPAWTPLVAAGMGVAGLGLGLSSVAATSMGTAVAERWRATASGVNNTSAQIGTAIGTALILLAAAATTGIPGPATGTPYPAWAAPAAVAALAAVAFALVRARPPVDEADPAAGAETAADRLADRRA
ncbi:MFS transporter [Plantactinospora siamensis]|uniref:MFS transporter n=1 Tax=Plantactinospora siamensis TaxID=555372 RepID=A0ABV6P5J8_9ACTN